MGTILIADDTPFWRDLVASALRAKGHRVFAADNGLCALAVLQKERIDLVILDAAVPKLDGFGFLAHIRTFPEWNKLPVIMLTSEMHREHILYAKKMGALEYLLKSKFSLPELLDRVGRRLHEAHVAPILPVDTAGVTAEPAAPPRLLTRQQSLDRAKEAMQARTLSGVVAEVIAAADSPKMELTDLAKKIGHEPVLAAQVLHAANSVENTAGRGKITTLADAVRVLGCAAVREIAASMGVFEAMPPPEPDGFNPIRCWQHSIAVARLCDELAPAALGASAYLVGLCHDLGEILFRTHFGSEYRQVLQAEYESGMSRIDAERHMLGITHAELVQVILKQLALPEPISRAIADFHTAREAGRWADNPMALVLKLADSYSAGLLLGSSDQGVLRPLSRTACRAATGDADPPAIDGRAFRAEVCKLLVQYARLSRQETAALIAPSCGENAPRVWLARDSAYSSFDPIAASLESQAQVISSESLPTPAEFETCRGLVIVSRNTATAPFSPIQVSRLLANTSGAERPVLWLTAKPDSAGSPAIPGVTVATGPIPLHRIADFLGAL
jgi:two-component system chemotaxis response regulator CheY